ncbi:MAG: hypothetical protein EYC70_11920 [Planctomycetota bacterium]|nr:MAG: hypothetical protein EYC70_11920 [Planctomycetota bacterium]
MNVLLLPLLALAQGQQPMEVSQRMEVGPLGPEMVREYRSGGVTYTRAQGGHVNVVTTPRWVDPDNSTFWICNDVSIGNDGADVMAGKWLNNQRITLYPGGSASNVWDFPTPASEEPQVSVADHAGICAGMQIVDMDPTFNYDFEATVYVWDTAGNGTPLWSYTFPRTLNYFGGGVAVSDDGSVILAWKADPNILKLRVEAFMADGTPISSGQLSEFDFGFDYFHSRQTRLSDDGTRAYFNIGVHGNVYDIASATVIQDQYIGGSFDSHAFSGDGKSYAFGFFGYFQVWRETSPGVWTMQSNPAIPGSTYVGWLDLNTDGSRCAYTVQRYSPSYDHIETGLYDVTNNVDFFRTPLDAPGTIYQLVTYGVDTDDAGDYVAGASWGDSGNVTPECYVYDSAGNLTASYDGSGSAFTTAIDAAGNVSAFGTKDVHANVGGNGGEVVCLDPTEQELHILGRPTLGGMVNVTVADTGNSVQLGVATALGSTMTPFGVSELDGSTILDVLGPFSIPPGGLNANLGVPPKPGLAGRTVHVQGGIKGGGGGHLTNRVSLQLLP